MMSNRIFRRCAAIFVITLACSIAFSTVVQARHLFWQKKNKPARLDPYALPLQMQVIYKMLHSDVAMKSNSPHGNTYPVREAAAKTLSTMGEDGLPLLFDALRNGDADLKVLAVQALAESSAERRNIVEFLDQMIRSEEQFGRVSIWLHYALYKLDFEALRHYKVLREALFGEFDIEPNIDIAFLREFGQGWRFYRKTAVQIFGRLGDKKSLDLLLRAYVDFPEIRWDIIVALGYSRSEYATVYLGTLLFQDLPNDMKSDVVWAIGMTGGEAGVGALVKFLDDTQPGPDMIRLIALSLGRIANSESIAVLDRLAYSTDELVRASVASALGQRMRDNSRATLALLIKDEQESVRVAAAESFSIFFDEVSIDILYRSLLQDASQEVKWAAACSLVRINTDGTLDLLKKALAGSDPDSAFYAGLALVGDGYDVGLPVVMKDIKAGDAAKKEIVANYLGNKISSGALELNGEMAVLWTHFLSLGEENAALRDYAFEVVAGVRTKAMFDFLENIVIADNEHPLRAKALILIATVNENVKARELFLKERVLGDGNERMKIYDDFEKYAYKPYSNFCVPIWDAFLKDENDKLAEIAFWRLYSVAETDYILPILCSFLSAKGLNEANAELIARAAVLVSGMNDGNNSVAAMNIITKAVLNANENVRAAVFDPNIFGRLSDEVKLNGKLFGILKIGAQDSSDAVRLAVSKCLMEIDMKEVMPILRRLASDQNEEIKIRSALCLANSWDSRIGAHALQYVLAGNNEDSKFRIFALFDENYAMRSSYEPEFSHAMLNVVEYAVNKGGAAVSEHAWKLLVRMCPKKSIKLFKRYAESSDDLKRLEANIVLAYAKEYHNARRNLRAFLKHRDSVYRERAARVLFDVWNDRHVLPDSKENKKEPAEDFDNE